MKRYIRLDIEYDGEVSSIHTVMNNIRVSIKEDMPWIKFINIRNVPDKERLDIPFTEFINADKSRK